MKKKSHVLKTKNFVLMAFMLVSLNGFAQTAYITNSNDSTVSVIDVATNTVTHTITVGVAPRGVSVSPDGTKVYVANWGDSTVSVINTASNTVTAIIVVGLHPEGIAVSPDGSRVYVTNNNSFGDVRIINANTNTVTDTIPVWGIDYGISASPDGSEVYVAASSYVSIINTVTDTVSLTITGCSDPHSLIVSPDGSKLYVTNISINVINVINTATNAVSAPITVGTNPMCISVSPDGSKVYVTNWMDSTVSVVNTATNTVLATISVGIYPEGISVSPDGSKVYVVNNFSNNVSVINTSTNTVSATIAVGAYPVAFGNFISVFDPNCFAHYTTSYDSTLNTFTLNVDSITSALAVSYNWDFGDGISSNLATPSHIYTLDTVYNVCLKIYTALGDSCEYCHIIGKDYLGNIYRTTGFTINVVNNTTSIFENNPIEMDIVISPNPFTSSTTITFADEQKNATIKITNVLGQEISTQNFTGKQLTIDKGEMKAGIYFVQITDEKKHSCNKKIILIN